MRGTTPCRQADRTRQAGTRACPRASETGTASSPGPARQPGGAAPPTLPRQTCTDAGSGPTPAPRPRSSTSTAAPRAGRSCRDSRPCLRSAGQCIPSTSEAAAASTLGSPSSTPAGSSAGSRGPSASWATTTRECRSLSAPRAAPRGRLPPRGPAPRTQEKPHVS